MSRLMELPLEVFDRVLAAFVQTADVPEIFRARAVCRTFAGTINNHLLSDSAIKVRDYMVHEEPPESRMCTSTGSLQGGDLEIMPNISDTKFKRLLDTKAALVRFYKKNLAVVVFNEHLRSQNYSHGLRIMLNTVAGNLMQFGPPGLSPTETFDLRRRYLWDLSRAFSTMSATAW
jgi:hypothetical protein